MMGEADRMELIGERCECVHTHAHSDVHTPTELCSSRWEHFALFPIAEA